MAWECGVGDLHQQESLCHFFAPINCQLAQDCCEMNRGLKVERCPLPANSLTRFSGPYITSKMFEKITAVGSMSLQVTLDLSQQANLLHVLTTLFSLPRTRVFGPRYNRGRLDWRC